MPEFRTKIYLTSISLRFLHSIRKKENTSYDICTEDKRPAKFFKLLKNSQLKQKLVQFLIIRIELAILGDNKVITLNYDQCYVFQACNDTIQWTIDYDLTCYQEDADSKIAYYICQLNSNYCVTVHCTLRYSYSNYKFYAS